MPKASTSRNPSMKSTPPSSSKEVQRKAVTKEITEVLWAIRRAARLPKTFAKPTLLRNEYCKAVAMYTGSSEHVDGNTHPRFGDLGRLYYSIFTGGTFGRIVYDPVCIPRALLESNDQFINLLLARKLLKPIPRSSSTKSTPGQSFTTPSSKGSTASSMKPSTSNSSSTSSPATGSSPSTTIKTVASSETVTVISDDEDDSDIEFGDIHPSPNYQQILQQRANLTSSPAYSAGNILLLNAMGNVQRARIIADAMSSPPPTSSPSTESPDEVERHLARKADSKISITVYVFTKDGVGIKDVQPIQARVSLLGRALFSLDLVESQLVAYGLTRSSSMQRFLPYTSLWKDIHWETPFLVKSGGIIALKLSPVMVKDWHIHAPHIFSG